MSRSVEIRVLRFTPRTWPLAVLAALVIVARSLPWLFGFVDDSLAATFAMGDTGYLAVNAGVVAVLVAPFPAYALLWRRMRRVGRIGFGMLLAAYGAWGVPQSLRAAVFLNEAVHTVAEARAQTRAARRAMSPGPLVAAHKAAMAGEHGFLALAGYAVSTPGVRNPCVLAKWGARVIRGTSDGIRSPGHARFQERAARFATRYNAAMAAELGISPAELARDGGCIIRPEMAYWPADAAEKAAVRPRSERR
jgi:hypothetical protein